METIQGNLVRVGGSGTPQRKRDGSLHRSAKGYIVTDPDKLRANLKDGGWDSRIVPHVRHVREYGNRVVVVEAWPVGRPAFMDNGDEYKPSVSFLLDHQGRQAFRIMPKVWRRACLNEFLGATISCNHLDKELLDILERPAMYAEQVLEYAKNTVQRIASMRGRPYGKNFLAFAKDYKPQVARKISYWLHSRYNRGDWNNGPTVWGALQAFSNSRSPWAIEKIQDGLTNHYTTLYNGEVPQAWIRAEEHNKALARARKEKRNRQ